MLTPAIIRFWYESVFDDAGQRRDSRGALERRSKYVVDGNRDEHVFRGLSRCASAFENPFLNIDGMRCLRSIDQRV